MCRFAELDYLVEDIYCYSEFHAPCGAIIRQLPKITDTYEDIQNLKIQNKLPTGVTCRNMIGLKSHDPTTAN